MTSAAVGVEVDEILTVILRVVMSIGGMALIIYAAYLQYVALPGEHAVKHVLTRAGLAAVGLVLILLGIRLFR